MLARLRDELSEDTALVLLVLLLLGSLVVALPSVIFRALINETGDFWFGAPTERTPPVE